MVLSYLAWMLQQDAHHMTENSITVETIASQRDIASVSAMLNQHNARLGLEWCPQPLAVFVKREDGEVLAGLMGSTHWNYLRISLLAVHSSLRGQGLGSKLLKEAEEEAIRRGCHFAFVDTYSFQAVSFYRKMGYEEFAQLEEYPQEHKRVFFRKRLAE